MKIEFTDVPPAESTEQDRRSERFTGSGGQVTFQTDEGEQFDGVVINESFGGVGIVFNESVPVTTSSEIEVTYHGVPTIAIVRHVSAFNKGGCMVGVHWKAAAIEEQMEELRDLCKRRDLNLPDQLLRLIDLLPGGVQLMLQLAENERWAELSEAINRLSSDADLGGVHGTDECLSVMMQLLEDAPDKREITKALDQLIDKYIEKTTQVALSHSM